MFQRSKTLALEVTRDGDAPSAADVIAHLAALNVLDPGGDSAPCGALGQHGVRVVARANAWRAVPVRRGSIREKRTHLAARRTDSAKILPRLEPNFDLSTVGGIEGHVAVPVVEVSRRYVHLGNIGKAVEGREDTAKQTATRTSRVADPVAPEGSQGDSNGVERGRKPRHGREVTSSVAKDHTEGIGPTAALRGHPAKELAQDHRGLEPGGHEHS